MRQDSSSHAIFHLYTLSFKMQGKRKSCECHDRLLFFSSKIQLPIVTNISLAVTHFRSHLEWVDGDFEWVAKGRNPSKFPSSRIQRFNIFSVCAFKNAAGVRRPINFRMCREEMAHMTARIHKHWLRFNWQGKDEFRSNWDYKEGNNFSFVAIWMSRNWRNWQQLE